MGFLSTTNVSGSNPGPNDAVLPDTVQMPTGNVWKIGRFALSLTPSAVATVTAPIQTFASTGIGLLTTDVVMVQPPSESDCGIVDAACGYVFGDRDPRAAELDCAG